MSIDIRASQGEHQARPSEVTQIELVAKSGETNDASKPAKAGGFNGFITYSHRANESYGMTHTTERNGPRRRAIMNVEYQCGYYN